MGTISTPTSMFGTAYLAVAWKDRSKLADGERKGFGQFFYVTICGYLEHFISELIRTRIRTLGGVPASLETQTMTHNFNLKDEVYSAKPLADSLSTLLDSIESELDNAPLQNLIKLHNRVFAATIRDRIGSDLSNDLNALADLRNIFAHGRAWRLNIDFQDGCGTPESTPIHSPAQRLHAAGILTELQFDGKTHIDFTNTFYSDDALLYFYNKVLEIEDKLLTTIDIPVEARWMDTLAKLPQLGKDIT